MTNQRKPRIGTIILAFILLIAGIGFGALQIANGVRAYGNVPSDDEIHRMEEYLELMENLEEILDTSSMGSADADRYLDGKLQNYDLTRSQEQAIRELYRDTLEKAEGNYLDQELAMNALTREIIYYRQSIPNPAQARSYMIRTLLIGGGAILLSLVVFTVLMKKPGSKETRQKVA